MLMTRRELLSITGCGLVGLMGTALAGCGGSRGNGQSSSGAESSASQEASPDKPQESSASAESSAAAAAADSVVIYFSRAGENYGVGVVDEGNTSIVAKIIAEKTGADTFEIVPSKDYPQGYDDCCDVALDEQHENARPAYKGTFDISGYKTVYLGYPIWWGDLPMCVYTFIEDHDWKGKEIHPFCTHEGSGLASTVEAIGRTCKGASVSEGLEMTGTTAQKSREKARESVEAWLK